MNRIEIRDASPADRAGWQDLWQGYLDFYQCPLQDHITETTWARIIDPISPVHCRLAVVDGQISGFSNRIMHPRTWAVEPACYLEDLYVADTMRGKGLGRALIDDLIDIGKREGWSNLYWHTNAGNETARKLYDRYDKADGYVRYRLPIKS